MPALHQSWPGTNRFCCGCAVAGPLADWAANAYWYSCVIIAIVPVSIFVTPQVWKLSPALPLLFYLTIGITTLFLNLTGCTDPGIIPRRPYIERQQKKHIQGSIEHVQLQVFLSQNQLNPLTKYCETCQIYRPMRASHCSSCNNCVEVFDHHCPFVNNCIGKRNYRFFIMFLVGVMSTMVILVVNIIVYIVSKTGTMDTTVVIIVGSLAVAIVLIPLFGFLIFHIYLVLSGKTTRQVIKRIDSTQSSRVQNVQWCSVDSPIINYFQEIPQSQSIALRNRLNQMRFQKG